MADKMMRIAGRSIDGYSKPLQTDSDGKLNISLTDSKSKVINAASTTLLKGESASVEGDASTSVAKTAYIYADKDGYCDIEVKIGGVWRSMLGLHQFKDTFTAVDNTPVSSDWLITKHGNASVNSKAIHNGGQLQATIESTLSYAQLGVTIDKKVKATSENIISFSLDETSYPQGVTTKDLIFGIVPTKATTGGSKPSDLAGNLRLFQLTNGSIVSSWAGTTTPITPSANAKYYLVLTADRIKVYRNGSLIIDTSIVLVSADYHPYFQLSTNLASGSSIIKLDNIGIYNLGNEETKVSANKLWIKTTADVVSNDMRVTFVNPITNDSAKVIVELQGQS